MGLGLGLIFAPAMSDRDARRRRRSDAGVASAMVNTTQQVGGSIGTALLSTIVATAVANYAEGRGRAPGVLAQAAVHGYTTAFCWSAAIFAVGAIVCGMLLRNDGRGAGHGPGGRAGSGPLGSRVARGGRVTAHRGARPPGAPGAALDAQLGPPRRTEPRLLPLFGGQHAARRRVLAH